MVRLTCYLCEIRPSIQLIDSRFENALPFSLLAIHLSALVGLKVLCGSKQSTSRGKRLPSAPTLEDHASFPAASRRLPLYISLSKDLPRRSPFRLDAVGSSEGHSQRGLSGIPGASCGKETYKEGWRGARLAVGCVESVTVGQEVPEGTTGFQKVVSVRVLNPSSAFL